MPLSETTGPAGEGDGLPGEEVVEVAEEAVEEAVGGAGELSRDGGAEVGQLGVDLDGDAEAEEGLEDVAEAGVGAVGAEPDVAADGADVDNGARGRDGGEEGQQGAGEDDGATEAHRRASGASRRSS